MASDFFLQEEISYDIPLPRVWIKLPVLLELLDLLVFPRAPELLDVLRNLTLSRTGIFWLTFFCVKLLPQVSLQGIERT